MSQTHAARLRRVGAGTAVGALVASALVLASPAQAAEKTLNELDVNLNYTRAAGSNTFLADGVLVKTVGTTSQSKAAGYFDTDIPLASSGNPSIDWSGTSPRPGTQLVIDFDGDGDEDGTLVGEPVYGANWWLPGNTLAGTPVDPAVRDAAPKVSGGGSADNGPLSAWRSAFPNATIKRAGWSLGSGIEGEGTIRSISVGSDDFYFTKAAVGAKTLRRSDVSPRDTRPQGRNTFRAPGGVRIYTLDASSDAKATGYFGIAEPLADVGEPTWDYAPTEGIEPGKQLVIDLDGSNSTTNDRGTLVGEPVYGKNWWLTNGSSSLLKAVSPQTGGGNGSNWFGTLNEWRLKAPNATVLEAGWSMGSGVKADGVLTAFKVGQTVYSFAGNRAPSAADVTGAIREGDDAIRVPLKGTDPDTDVYTDVYGAKAVADTLTYTVSGADGSATVDGDELVYDAGSVSADFSDDFTYTVTDDRGATATAAVSIAVTANGAPVVEDLTASTRTNDQVDIDLSATDPEGDDVTFTVTQPAHGSAELNQAGTTVTYTPDDDYDGADTFTYTATDDRGAASTADIDVTVAANGAPVVEDLTASTRTNDQVDIDLSATDPEGDDVTFTVTQPAHGSAELNQAGTKVTYTPDEDYDGADTFTYTATDDRGAASTADIDVTVAANRAPVAADVTGSTKAGQAVTVDLSATDADGDTLTYSATGSNGTAVVNGDELTFTPATGFAGTATFTYTVNDGRGGTDTGTVTITVAKVASTIVVTKIGPETPKTTSNLKFTVKVTAAGASLTGAPVTVKVNQAVIGKGVLASNGTVTVRSNFKFAKGTKTFSVNFGGNATVSPSSTTVKVVIK